MDVQFFKGWNQEGESFFDQSSIVAWLREPWQANGCLLLSSYNFTVCPGKKNCYSKHWLLLTNRAEADLYWTPVSVNSLNSTGQAKPFKMMDVIITLEANMCVCMRVCVCDGKTPPESYSIWFIIVMVAVGAKSSFMSCSQLVKHWKNWEG